MGEEIYQKALEYAKKTHEGQFRIGGAPFSPQKKQEKKDAAMRAALEIGDQVVTIGGIVGRVVAIKEDTFVLRGRVGARGCILRKVKCNALAGLHHAISARKVANARVGAIDRMHDLQVGALIGRLFERVGKLGVAVEHLGRNAGERHAGDYIKKRDAIIGS